MTFLVCNSWASARERSPITTKILVNYPSQKIRLWRHRTDSPGRGKKKQIPPLSLRELCPPLFQKALEMIEKLESVNWANVWWVLGADHLTFDWVMVDFRKKMYILQTDFEEEKACKEIPGENNILH